MSPPADADPDSDTQTKGEPSPLPDVITQPDIVPDHPNSRVPPDDPEGCHGLYAQDIVPEFDLEIAPEEWAALVDEWVHGVENLDLEEAGELEDHNPYHPVERFRYGDIEITDAMVRLRGNPVWWPAQGKLQLQVSFDEVRPTGRLLGLKKLIFDAATFNRTFLRDRLSLAMLRDAGVPAPCANNARLNVNGSYYGVFTNIERLDKDFLERRFEDPSGDLWKRGMWELRTNQETGTSERLERLKAVTTVQELSALLDLPAARKVWAVEAVLPNSDGPWAGGLNFFLYDDPTSGKFILLPWDLDNTFWRLPVDTDPYTWRKEERFYGRPWYDLATSDPDQFKGFVADIDDVLAHAYATDRAVARIDAWTEQIDEYVFEDPNKPFSNARYLEAVGDLRLYVQDRHRFVSAWTACWKDGGVDDGSGHCVPQ